MTLKRIFESRTATYGVLIDDVPFAVTLELAWRGNEANMSCIPAGVYYCRRHNSPHFGEVFKLQNVPNRTNILMHKGNIDADTKGCILVAEQYERIFYKQRWWNAVLRSRKGFNELMKRGGENFWLEIVDCTGKVRGGVV